MVNKARTRQEEEPAPNAPSPFFCHEEAEYQGGPIQVFENICCLDKYLEFQQEELRLADYLRPPAEFDSKRFFDKMGELVNVDFFQDHRQFAALCTGETFSVKVGQGNNQKIFKVHEAALRKCAPFAAAIEPGRWRASVTHQLDLSDDDPEIFASMLEYLYTGEFSPHIKAVDGVMKLDVLLSRTDEAVFELAQLFCLADQYCLETIKPLIVNKLNLCQISPAAFLNAADFAYDSLPDQDQHCPFKRWAGKYIDANREELLQCSEMKAIVEKGGNLAWDIFKHSRIMSVA